MIKHVMMILVMVLLLGFSLFGGSLLSAMAEEADGMDMNCYYKSVQIQKGDSLWTIAEEYSADTGFSIPEYIGMLKQMNRLREDVIHVGEYLTVMYLAEAE